jgi:GDP-L-fucose synthase
MPTNLYGPRDNFDLETSHVFPALINRYVTARRKGASEVTLWGTGAPKREFLHSTDLASAVLLAVEKYDSELHLNIGTGEDLSIKELSTKISQISGFKGGTKWDPSKPDGTPRKVLDVSRLRALGWKPKVSLDEGIRETIQYFESNYN